MSPVSFRIFLRLVYFAVFLSLKEPPHPQLSYKASIWRKVLQNIYTIREGEGLGWWNSLLVLGGDIFVALSLWNSRNLEPSQNFKDNEQHLGVQKHGYSCSCHLCLHLFCETSDDEETHVFVVSCLSV